MFLGLLMLLWFEACQTHEQLEEGLITEARKDWQDSTVQLLTELQDHLEIDSLISFAQHKDPTYRYGFAKAMASLQSPNAVPALVELLNDTIIDVAAMAAFALGQIESSNSGEALTQAFASRQSYLNSDFQKYVLEAVGKVGEQKLLPLISSASTYQPSDHNLLLGQSRAIYRFMQRNIIDETGSDRMLGFLENEMFPQEVRMIAANYFSRLPDSKLKSYGSELSDLLQANSKDPEITMFLCVAVGKSQFSGGINQLNTMISNTEDYRVKCNALRGLSHYPFSDIKRILDRSVYDRNHHVSQLAAEIILDKATSSYWRDYMNRSLGNFRADIKIRMLGIANKLIPHSDQMFKGLVSEYIRQRLKTGDDYQRAQAIKAYAYNISSWNQIVNLYEESNSRVIKNACLEGLIQIIRSGHFQRLNENSRQQTISTLLNPFHTIDVGGIFISGQFLLENYVNLEDYNVDFLALLKECQQALTLPKDIEAYQVVHQLLSNYEGPQEAIPFIYSHPADWSLLNNLTDSSSVRVVTDRGTIEIQLLPQIAPATVANFLELIELNYYNDKFFHRVVPNFVVQTGCDRGDGFGSLDYSIRSELPPIYYNGEGWVGMASAGKDTESAQWFITHCPTPHLDGRYTIFGKVTAGMEIVYDLEVGDKIISVEYQKGL